MLKNRVLKTDSDGINSCILLASFLNRINKKHIKYVNKRKNGYGLFNNILKSLYNEYKFDSIISADLGITSGIEVDKFKSEFKNINICLSDHHNIQDELLSQESELIIDPKLTEEKDSIFYELCGCCVVYKLIIDYCLQKNIEIDINWKVIAGIATVGDMVNLHPTQANYWIVKEALEIINNRFYELSEYTRGILNISRTSWKDYTEYDFGFSICPSMNATSRYDKETLVLDYFDCLSDSMINEIKALNNKRKKEQKEIEDLAFSIVKSKPETNCILCLIDSPNKNLLGLVASSLMNRYKKPTIVLNTETFSGSGRSVNGFNIYDKLKSYPQEWFVNLGGHSFQ